MNKVLLDIINNSKSRNDILFKYFGKSNGQYYRFLNEFIIENKIDVSHLEKKVKVCPQCGKVVKKWGNTFCNRSCSASFTNKGKVVSEETKTKIRFKLKGKKVSEEVKEQRRKLPNTHLKHGKYVNKPKERTCKLCGTSFIADIINRGKRSSSNFCSSKCRNKYISELRKNDVKNGVHKGWQSRNIESYPEKFFKIVLNNNNIKFEHNYPVNKKDLGLNDLGNYFLDFFIENKKIDLEIDGKQHKERKEHDEIRDFNLTNNGYYVYRIKWKNINNKKGQEYIKNEIDEFLNFYNEYGRCNR